MKQRASWAVLVALAVIVGLLLTTRVAGHADLNSAVNAYRAAHDLPALATSASLETVAHARAVEVVTDFHHTDLTPRVGCWQWGEVIAWHTRPTTAEGFVAQWDTSPTHKAVLLGNWSLIGSGTYDATVTVIDPETGESHQQDRTYAVVITMRPCAPAPTPQPPIVDEIPNTATDGG